MSLPAPMYTWPPEIDPPPRGEDLPCSDGDKLETQRHVDQIEILVASLWQHWADRQDVYVGREMFFYFSTSQAKNNDFRGPDVFVATGVERKERKSWVVWEENGKVPDVIIEVTSASTIREDHIRKKQVYASIGIPEYFIYDPFTHELTPYRLVLSPRHYAPIPPGPDGRFPCLSLGLSLGLHDSAHRGFPGPWLRWFEGDRVLPTLEEKAQQADSEAERLRQMLLKAGIDPDRA